MCFWTECSLPIGSERLYIPHSRTFATGNERPSAETKTGGTFAAAACFCAEVKVEHSRNGKTDHNKEGCFIAGSSGWTHEDNP